MSTFLTSDLHIGHARCATMWRGYRGPDTMNRAIIDAWNDTVTTNDTVWILGDLVMGKIARTLPLVAKLNGRKHLLAGNHDRMFEPACTSKTGILNESKMNEWTEKYRSIGGISSVHHGIIDFDDDIIMCHFPYGLADHTDETRFVNLRPDDRGKWLLHGHLHGAWRQHGRMIDVGWDAWKRPVHEQEIRDLIAAGPNELQKL